MMKIDDKINRIARNLEDIDAPDEAYLDKLRRQMHETHEQTRNQATSQKAIARLSQRRSPLYRVARIAAAALITVGVGAGVWTFMGSEGSSDVWAGTVDNVMHATTVTFRLKTKVTGGPTETPDSESFAYESSEFGSRVDIYMNDSLFMQMYYPKDNNTITTITPPAKKYMLMTVSDEQRKQMHAKEKNPREFVKLFLSIDHKKLGRKTIDGIEVEGIEVNSPLIGGGMFEQALGRIWVDINTQWPVLMEIKGTFNGGKMTTTMVMDKFQWDKPLDATMFTPVIPEDYSLQGQMTIPEITEKSLIEALRLYAEMTSGKYPESMALNTVNQEFTKAWVKKHKKAPEGDDLNILSKVTGGCGFYAQLVEQGKNPEYHGDKVTADDHDSILIRWELSKTEYRIIYGDLRIETVANQQSLIDKALEQSGTSLTPDKRSKVIRMLNLNETDLIKGLNVWLELLDGRYPDTLTPETAIKHADQLLSAKYGESDKDQKKQLEQKTADIFFASVYYNKLIREKKDVVYRGDKFTIKDGDKMLMRWKNSEDQYSILLCDLTLKNVSAGELEKLEAAILD